MNIESMQVVVTITTTQKPVSSRKKRKCIQDKPEVYIPVHPDYICYKALGSCKCVMCKPKKK